MNRVRIFLALLSGIVLLQACAEQAPTSGSAQSLAKERFAIREGGRTVGAGQVTEIISSIVGPSGTTLDTSYSVEVELLDLVTLGDEKSENEILGLIAQLPILSKDRRGTIDVPLDIAVVERDVVQAQGTLRLPPATTLLIDPGSELEGTGPGVLSTITVQLQKPIAMEKGLRLSFVPANPPPSPPVLIVSEVLDHGAGIVSLHTQWKNADGQKPTDCKLTVCTDEKVCVEYSALGTPPLSGTQEGVLDVRQLFVADWKCLDDQLDKKEDNLVCGSTNHLRPNYNTPLASCGWTRDESDSRTSFRPAVVPNSAPGATLPVRVVGRLPPAPHFYTLPGSSLQSYTTAKGTRALLVLATDPSGKIPLGSPAVVYPRKRQTFASAVVQSRIYVAGGSAKRGEPGHGGVGASAIFLERE